MNTPPTPSVTIDRPRAVDRARWAALYQGYAQFYRVEMTSERLETVWRWINDPTHEVEALLARSGGSVLGLAHFRPFARPLRGETGMFLDDLFVDAQARGRGVGAALLQAVKQEAQRRGCTMVRWITADDNYRARTLYDQHAVRTTWITYDMAVPPKD